MRRSEKLRPHQVGALIIVPTRELAQQVSNVFQEFLSCSQLSPQISLLTIVGGLNPNKVIREYREKGGNIIVATPGRLDVLITKIGLDTKELEVLVLDEADRLLGMGFAAVLNSILSHLPKQRRTGIFSATQTQELQALARAGLRNGEVIRLGSDFNFLQSQPVEMLSTVLPEKRDTVFKDEQDEKESKKRRTDDAENVCSETAIESTSVSDSPLDGRLPQGLANYYCVCPAEEKLYQLLHFFCNYPNSKGIVYFLTCNCVQYFSQVLPLFESCGNSQILSLHGRMPLKKRTKTLDDFFKASSKTSPAAGDNNNKSTVLLTTDVAARGIDFPDVDWILQFDPPQDPNVFVHRIGRTARMGKTGVACAFLLPQESTYIDFLHVRKIPIQEFSSFSSLSPPPETPEIVLQKLTRFSVEDRDIFEASSRAFVSYVRAYSEHQCSYIFQLKKLPWVDLFRSFGLLRVPVMPELKNLQFLDFDPVSHSFDFDEIPFKNQDKEKIRLEALQSGEIRAKRLAKKQKMVERKKEKKLAKKKGKLHSKHYVFDPKEEEELAKEAKLLKKLKQGKITEEEFDRLTGNEEHDEENHQTEDKKKKKKSKTSAKNEKSATENTKAEENDDEVEDENEDNQLNGEKEVEEEERNDDKKERRGTSSKCPLGLIRFLQSQKKERKN
nr:ATP-dependent RNA helicase [Paratrimastix eleionoma]